jgi:hypothetical protein
MVWEQVCLNKKVMVGQDDRGLTMKKAYVKIPEHLLKSFLLLPNNINIENVFRDKDDYYDDLYTLILTGDDLPDGTEVVEGRKIERVNFQYRTINKKINTELEMIKLY